MKKTIIILLVTVTFASSTVFAGEFPVIPEKIAHSFKENFPKATGVSWAEKSGLRIVEFSDNQLKHFAYFDENANLVAVMRYVNTTYMPLKTSLALKEKFGDLGTITALEITLNEDEVFYLIDIIHNNKSQTIKVYPGGNIVIMKSKRLKL